MGLMDKLREPAVGGGVAAGVLALAAVIAWFNLGPEPAGRQWQTEQTYYDLNTKQTFIGKPIPEQVPPIEAPSGKPFEGEPAGVMAVMYACDTCEPASEQFIGYLEKYTPEGKAEWAKPEGQRDLGVAVRHRRIRKLEGGEWISTDTAEGAAIVQGTEARCVGKRLIKCTK
jgi:hypothetical protein